MAMFKKALAIVLFSAVTATSVAAHASDWGNGAPHAAPGNERHWNDNAQPRYPYHYAPPRYASPHYVAPYRYAPAYRWAPPPYRLAPAPYRVWYPGYAYRGYGDHHDYDDRRGYCPDR
jgi:hypothetical protein